MFVGYVLQPIYDLTIETLLNRDVRHGRGRCGAVPMLLPGRKPDHITRVNLLDGAPFLLSPTAAPSHN